MKTAAATHLGRRRTNQDRHIIRRLRNGGTLLAVADGMGGNAGGEEAASQVVKDLRRCEISKEHPLDDLAAIIQTSCERIRHIGDMRPELEGLGCTLTAVFLLGSTLFWAHVGDSRLYVMHSGTLRQISVDQTLVQGLIENGVITVEKARTHPLRHMLDQCVGCPDCVPERGEQELRPGDLVLLSTDGLHDTLTEQEISELLREQDRLEKAADALVRATQERRGSDNVTVVLARAE
jgi:PPM family protein phosphatase